MGNLFKGLFGGRPKVVNSVAPPPVATAPTAAATATDVESPLNSRKPTRRERVSSFLTNISTSENMV
jgi:hypothetical protein